MKKIITVIILLLIFNINVSALTLKPTGDITGIRNDEISIYLTLEKMDYEKSVSAIDGELDYDKNIFELIDYSILLNDWTELSEINNKIFAYANLKFNNLLLENQNILKIVFKVKEKAKYGNSLISINYPNATDENGEKILINGDKHIVKILSDENKLSNIKLSNGEIKFNENNYNYNLTVKNAVTEMKIDASLKDINSIFVNNYGPRVVKLNVGKNLIQLKVKSESNQINTYNINIIREESRVGKNETDENLNSNNYLSEIIINNKKLKFNKEEYEHFITVDYKEEKADLLIKTESELATYEIIGSNNLEVGENIFYIKVKAEDNTLREYKIIVNRKEENIKLSNNSKLKDLTINGYKIDFNKEIYDYNIKIKNENQLSFLYSTDDSNSNVIISGNQNLKNNSIIRITVVAEDQSVTEYRVKVQKDNPENNIILIVLTILSFGLLTFIGILIMQDKYKSKRKK